MEGRTGPVFFALILVASAVGGAAAASVGSASGTASSTPRVAIAADGGAITDGSYYETGHDPELTIEAEVGAATESGTELAEIVVRADGERTASIDVDGTNVTETVTPDLTSGNTTVRVIVTDEAGNANSTTVTVNKDSVPPIAFLTEPYDTAPWKAIEDGNATGGNVTLAGEIRDDSTVDELLLRHSYGDERIESYRIDRPGTNFSVPLALGRGDNGIHLTLIDEYENVRLYEFEVNASDAAQPEISLAPLGNETTTDETRIEGTVSDDVWVRHANLSIAPPDTNETIDRTIAAERAYEYDPSRQSIGFEKFFIFSTDGTYEITLTATDATGQTVTETTTIDRVPEEEVPVAPTIEIDRDRTIVLDS
jgi:hypothetical protein